MGGKIAASAVPTGNPEKLAAADLAFLAGVTYDVSALNDGVTPEPFGDPGGPGLWHRKGKQLPPYIQQVAHGIMRSGEADESRAIATAVSRCKVWCATGTADTKAKACAAIAEWEADKADTKAAVRAAVPDLVTIPGVDLLAAGTWELSSGRNTFTREDIANAIDAAKCPAVGAPVIKLGHVDPRFDGEPAIGRVRNLRTDDSGSKLVGDLTDMPGWLGSIAHAAFPRRSVEGSYGFKCQIGHDHPFVLTGLALLGITAPGVGVLSDLKDVATLYGVDAANHAALTERPWQFTTEEGEPHVAVTEEDIRRAYYAAGSPADWWITEMQMSPTQLVVADGGGKIYRVPFTIAGDGISFGSAEPLEDYAALSAARGTGHTVTYASAAESRSLSAADNNGWTQRDGEWVYDPDNDGDNDATASGDTDNSHWDADGNMKPGVKIPPKPTSAAADPTKPYGDVEYADPGYLDADGNQASKSGKTGVKRYPLSSDKIEASWSYINQDKNAGQYTPAQLTAIKGKIKSAMTKAGHTVSDKSKAASTGSYDPVTGEVTADAATPPTMDSDGNETGNMNNSAMTHGSFTGTHTHVHAANGSQGADDTHSHSHTHSGDADHGHTHAASNSKEGSNVEFSQEQEVSLRKILGLDEDAELTPEAVINAGTSLRETADQKVAAAGRYKPPAGVVQIEQEQFDRMQREIEASGRFRAKVERSERDEVIGKAIRDGKFSAARQTHWSRLWDADPEGTREVLATLKKNVVPVDDIGSGGGNIDDDAYESEFASLYPPGTFKAGR